MLKWNKAAGFDGLTTNITGAPEQEGQRGRQPTPPKSFVDVHFFTKST